MANVNKVIDCSVWSDQYQIIRRGRSEAFAPAPMRKSLPKFADYATAISNDMPEAGGGGASAGAEGVGADAPAAASDDDGGDGDGDPDPERPHHPSPSHSPPSPSPRGHQHRNVSAPPDGLLWSMPKLVAAIGISRAGIYTRIEAGNFPPPLKIGRSSRWLASEIHAWVNAQACARPLKTAR
jgi:predicted DNA-binding transcriptional regulator AlpA